MAHKRENQVGTITILCLLGALASAGITPPKLNPTPDVTLNHLAPPTLPTEVVDQCIVHLNRAEYARVLDRLHLLNPTQQWHPMARILKASAQVGRGQLTRAQDIVAQIHDAGQVTSHVWSLLAAEYLKQQRPLQAMRICQHALMNDAHSTRLLLQAGRAWYAVGELESALVLFRAAQQGNTHNDRLDIRLLNEAIVNTLVALGRYHQAGRILEDPQQPVFVSPALTIARAHYHTGEADYEQALQIVASHNPAISAEARRHVTAQIHLLAGRPQQAMEHFESLGDIRAQLVCALQARQAKMAKTQLKKLATTSLSASEQALYRVAVLLNQGQIRDARKAMQDSPMPFYEWQALESFQTQLQEPEMGTLLAFTTYCLNSGYPQQARQAAQAATQVFPQNVIGHYLLAESYGRLGQHAKACNTFDVAVASLPESHTLRFLQAQAYQATGRTALARKQLQFLLSERPDFADAVLVYGEILTQSGEVLASVPIYKEALNYHPNRLSLLKAYAWSLLETKAFQEFTIIRKRLARHAGIDETTLKHYDGWLAYQQEDGPRALALLTEALEQWPGHPELCYHLGRASLALGKRHQARQLFDYALYYEVQRKRYAEQVSDLKPLLMSRIASAR